MKKALLLLCVYLISFGAPLPAVTYAFTGDIAEESFTIQVSEFFPWMSTKAQNSSDKGIDNVSSLIIGLIPMITTMMAVGATLMVIWGGFHMVLGGASTSQTEKGKGIMKDAIIGLILGLLAYIIITLLGSILAV